MRKILFIIFIAASFYGKSQAVEGTRGAFRDSLTSLTNNTDLLLIGLGTGGVRIEKEYTLPKTDGTANQVFKTDGAGNIVFDNVSFSEIEGTDTVLTISDTVSTLATQYDLTQIQGYTVTNEADNRVITSTGAGTGNAETNLTFDGTDLNIVSGGLQVGGTEVISSGRAITGTTANFSGPITSSSDNYKNHIIIDRTADPNISSVFYITPTFSGDLDILRFLTFDGVDRNLLSLEYNTATQQGSISTIGNSLTAGAITVTSFTNSGVAGTGTRLKTASSTGVEGTIANGTDGQVMTMVSGSPAWDDPTGIGGSTGSTDNAILRADGTGGSTLQNSSIYIDDLASSITTVHTGTTDGADNRSIRVSGGGNDTSERGAFISLNGNESSAAGELRLVSGNGAGGNILLSPQNGSVQILGNNNLLLTGDLSTTAGRVSTGYFTNITSTNAVNVDSDINLKKNIHTIKSGLDVIGEINPVSYKWKDKERGKGKHYGVIAQELKEVLPDLVNNTGGNLAVAYSELIPFLIRAVQEQQQQIEDLQNQINQ